MSRTGPMPGPFHYYWAPSHYTTPAVRAYAESFEALSAHLDPNTGLFAGRSRYRTKESVPLLFTAGYVDGAAGKGGSYLDPSRYPPYFVVDLDDVKNADGTSATLEQACADITALIGESRHDIWTSFSHGKPGKGTRVRILLALTRPPASHEEYNLLWKSLCVPGVGDLAEMGPDKECRDVTRGQAWPCGDIATPDVPMFYRRVNVGGPALSTDAMLLYAKRCRLTADPMKQPARVTAEDLAKIGGKRKITAPMLINLAARLQQRACTAPDSSRDRLDATVRWLTAVATGKPWGTKGTRNTRVVQGLWAIAFHFPDFDIESVVKLTTTSCRKMREQKDASTVYDENFIRSKLVAKAPHANALRRENEERDRAQQEFLDTLGEVK